MSANTNPIFPLTPHVGVGKVVTACTDRTGGTTGNIVTVLAANTNGTIINRVTCWAEGTVAAAIVWLWLYDGTNYYLYEEILVTAISPNTTTTTAWNGQSVKITLTTPLVLQSGWSLKASTTVTQSSSVPIVVTAEGGDY